LSESSPLLTSGLHKRAPNTQSGNLDTLSNRLCCTELAGTRSVGHGSFGYRQDRGNSVCVSYVKEHSFRGNALYLSWRQIDYEQRLAALNLERVRALLSDPRHDGTDVVSEVDLKRHQPVRALHFADRFDHADSHVDLFDQFGVNHLFGWSGAHDAILPQAAAAGFRMLIEYTADATANCPNEVSLSGAVVFAGFSITAPELNCASSGRKRYLQNLVRQKKSWVDSGSGSLSSERSCR
jgi:hypothetical protein